MASVSDQSTPTTVNLGRRVTLTFGTYGIAYALAFVTSVFVARAYGPEGKGLLAIASAIPAMVFELGKLGQYNANAYFSATEPDILGRLYGNSLAFGVSVGVACGAIVWLIAPWIGLGPRDVPPEALAAVCVSIPFFFIFSLLTGTLVGGQRTVAFNAFLLATSVLPFAIVVTLVPTGFSASQVVIARSAMFMALAAVIAAFCLRTAVLAGTIAPSGAVFFRTLRYGLKPYVASLLGYVTVRSDVFLVNYFLGSTALGIYSIDVTLVTILVALPASVGLMMMPRVAHREGDERVRYFEMVSRVTMSLVLAETVIAVILVDPAVRLVFGDAFTDAVPVFYVLAPGVLAMAFVQVSMQFFSGIGYPIAAAVLWLPGAILNVGFNIAALSRLGILAAGISSTVSYVLMASLTLAYLHRRHACGIRSLLVPRPREVLAVFARAVRGAP